MTEQPGRAADRRSRGHRRARRRAPAAPRCARRGRRPDRPRAHAGLRLPRPRRRRRRHAGRARHALSDRLDQQVVCGRGAPAGARGRPRRPAGAGHRLRALVCGALALRPDHAAPPAQPHLGADHGHRVHAPRRAAPLGRCARPTPACARASASSIRTTATSWSVWRSRRVTGRPVARARGRAHRRAARHGGHRDDDPPRLAPARRHRLRAPRRRPAGARRPAARSRRRCTESCSADGSIVSSAADMLAYARLILNRGDTPGGRLLSEESLRALDEQR